MTMSSVLKHITSQHSLENSLYALAAVNQSGSVTSLKPNLTVNDLELPMDITVVKRHKNETPTLQPKQQHEEEEVSHFYFSQPGLQKYLQN